MEIISIAIVSRDKAYNRALSLSLINAYKDFKIKLFDSRQFIKEWSDYKGKGTYYNCFDIVLWAGDEIIESYGDNIVFLADRDSLIHKDYVNNKFSIYKYSPASAIVGSIFDIYTHLTGRSLTFIKKDDVKLLGFASPAGGTGCTTVAMAVGQEFARFYDKKVLYLTFEDVESTGDMIERAGGSRHIGEFIYRLLSHKERIGVTYSESIPFMEGFIGKTVYGIEGFNPCKGRNPLRELTVKDIQKFIASLIDCGRYDVIIADLSTCLTEAALATMELASRLCMITKTGGHTNREDNYLSQIICCSGEKTLDKFIKIENMCRQKEERKESREKTAEEILETGMHISVYEGKSMPGSPVLEGEFGRDISALSRELMEPIQGTKESNIML